MSQQHLDTAFAEQAEEVGISSADLAERIEAEFARQRTVIVRCNIRSVIYTVTILAFFMTFFSVALSGGWQEFLHDNQIRESRQIEQPKPKQPDKVPEN